MSRSPKYSLARSIAERLERAAQQRAERQRRRREEAERQQRVAVAAARDRATVRCTVLVSRRAALAEQTGVPTEELAAELTAASAAIAGASSLGALHAEERRLDAIERRLVEARALAARDRQYAGDRLTETRRALGEVDPAVRQRFDRTGALEVSRLLAAVEATPAPAQADELARVAGEHLHEVLTARARYEQQRREANALLDELEVQLRGLADDARAADVRLKDGERLTASLELLRAELAEERPEEVLRLGRILAQRLRTAEEELDLTIDRISERRDVLRSLVQAMPGVGFAVVASSVREASDGTITVQAQRHGGEQLVVRVEDTGEDEHRVLYTTDTMVRQEATGTLGEGAVCTSLVEVIEKLQASARTQGFDMGRVTWEGAGDRQPPSQGGAVALPPPARQGLRRDQA
ncbi:hypothetical protein [Phytohabitans houttuyneae]|uniref:Uncharacterized protein n=1 Tax=Phytohabitans houttuyneae TaxID=1076126 RepID=A0A6V8KKR6_9ACTN|nr:hypothetical protein [Phytohabitans houttuyneae]GFJ85693.1 hypothetical protein Phou_098730 [Phytohabitans houttuyneae]